MLFRVSQVAALFLAASVSGAAVQYVIMPKEIGVSCLKRKPFTAIARTTISRVFPSGAQRTVTVEDRIARDGQGRVLREQHLPWTEDPAKPIYYINILDNGAMQHVQLDPQKHIASMRPVDTRYTWDYVPYDGKQYRLSAPAGASVHTELLGNREIEGLKCWGQRTTYTFPAGTLHGNQQQVTRTWESWYSSELGADVWIVAHDPDPAAGDQETELTGIVRGEPDAGIFAVPAGYLVQARTP